MPTLRFLSLQLDVNGYSAAFLIQTDFSMATPCSDVASTDQTDAAPAAPTQNLSFALKRKHCDEEQDVALEPLPTACRTQGRFESMSMDSLCAPVVASHRELNVQSQCLDSPPRAASCIKAPVTNESREVYAKKARKSVRFDGVQVYMFERSQGFTCVPSQGGSTLGMTSSHWNTCRLTTKEHLMKRANERRYHLWTQHCSGKVVLPSDVVSRLESIFGQQQQLQEQAAVEDEEVLEREVEGLDELYFLQPVPIRQRRAMLRQAGVTRIDADERSACQVCFFLLMSAQILLDQ